MISAETLCRTIAGLNESELARWIEQRWVMPEGGPGSYLFQEIDVARVRLICEMKQELSVDEEALPMVLSLLDQVYALREQLRKMYTVLGTQPEDVRNAVAEALQGRR